MKTFVSIIILLSIVLCLAAQFDEKAIMTQQAQQLMARRQYAEAEQLFRQILQKFPSDANSVLQIIQICYLTSQLDKAEAVLEEHRRALSPAQYSEQMILLYVMQGKQNQAWTMAQSYLQQNNHDQNRYRLIASYFERRGFYEQVLELYNNARRHFKNDDLFILEYANTALNYRRLDTALNEYLRFLDQNPGNFFFVNNQCKTILQEDPSMIRIISAYANNATNPIILELYATALVSLKQYQQALEIYRNLSPQKLQSFAEDQYSALNDEIALLAYSHLVDITADDVQRAEYRYRMAQIKTRNARFSEAHDILNEIISDKRLHDRRVRNRSSVNLNSRKMMAELILNTTAQIDSAMAWYDSAKEFARTTLERTEIEMEIIKLLIMSEAYNTALQKLNSVIEPKVVETKEYYRLLISLMQNEIDHADSLMNEYVIKYPGSSYTNDSIYLMMLILAMDDADIELFMTAYRKKQLYQKDAIDSLLTIFEHNKDEELRILAVEWAIQLSDPAEALRILDYEWTDDIAAEYATLIKLRLLNDGEREQRLAREFLKQNPNSIFSPNFRQVISRISTNKPNL